MEHSSIKRSLLTPFIESLYRLAWIVEARDPYTGGHLWRVSQYSRIVAQDMLLNDEDVARIELGGFLHDLGKVGIPDAILNKPSSLDEMEYAIIKTHPSIGARLLTGHPLAELALDAVLLHHEMPDGRGYPHGLVGDQIPLIAKIVGVCDAFDAMTSIRPYRQGMPLQKALSIISDASGKQFDADVSSRLIRLGNEGELDHILGHSDDGIPLMECSACGPTILVTRKKKNGDLVYCRHCKAESEVVSREPGLIKLTPTGGWGSVIDMETEIDEELLADLVKSAEKHLSPKYRNLFNS